MASLAATNATLVHINAMLEQRVGELEQRVGELEQLAAAASWVGGLCWGALRAFSALSVGFLFLLPLCGVKRPALRGERLCLL